VKEERKRMEFEWKFVFLFSFVSVYQFINPTIYITCHLLLVRFALKQYAWIVYVMHTNYIFYFTLKIIIKKTLFCEIKVYENHIRDSKLKVYFTLT